MSINPDNIVRLKYRDTAPVLEVELLDSDGTAVDLTSADAIYLHIALENSDVRIEREMDIEGVPTLGTVRYEFEDTDWEGDEAITPGLHRMEYEVVAGTSRQTYPNGDPNEDGDHASLGENAYHWLRVWGDLGQGEP